MPNLIEKTIESAIRKCATVEVADLADKIGIDENEVRDHLWQMQCSGKLAAGIEEHTLSELSAISVSRVVSHGEAVFQPVLNLETPSREERGIEDITDSDGCTIRAAVAPETDGEDGKTGRYILNVVRNPGEDAEYIIQDKIFAPDQHGDILEARAAAWAFWDEMKSELSPFAEDDDEDQPTAGEWPSGPYHFRLDADGRRFRARATRAECGDILYIAEEPCDEASWFFEHKTSPKARLYNDPQRLVDFANELLRSELAKTTGPDGHEPEGSN